MEQINQKIITRTTCRLCGSDKLEEIFTLGNLYVSTFLSSGEKGIRAPLDIILCKNCTLLQLRHTAPMELMYSRFYWYRSGVTTTMRKALQHIAENIEVLVPLKEGDVVLDIGAKIILKWCLKINF